MSTPTLVNFIIICAASAPLVIFGIFGNILTLVMLLRSKVPSSESTKLKFVHLTVTDLGTLLFSGFLIIFKGHTYIDPSSVRLFRLILPYTGSALSHWPSLVSSLVVMFLALERATAVVKPFKVRVLCSLNLTRVALGFSYVIVGVLCIIKAAQYRIVSSRPHYKLERTIIGENKSLMKFIDASILSLYCLPICVTLLCNLAMVLSLLRSAKNVRIRVADVRDTRKQKDRKVTMMVFFLTLMFIICVAPSAIFRTLIALDIRDNIFVQKGVTLCSLLKIMNHSLNFVVYIVVVPDYRKAFLRMFHRNSTKIMVSTMT